jgi:hypothetical protein
MILDWTVALFFRPDVTKVELSAERNEFPTDGAIAIAAGSPRAMGQLNPSA